MSTSHNETSASAESSKRPTTDAIDDSLERKESESNPSAPASLLGNNISIFFRLVSGRKLRIEVNTNDEVGSLKSKIVSMTPIEMSDEYWLFYRGKSLSLVKKIEECGIKRDSIIHVFERIRSKEAMEMWNALKRMVIASKQMCEVGYDSDNNLKIRIGMTSLLKEVKKGSDELGERYLAMFRSLSCEDALVGLHLSPVKQNADLGCYVIGSFFDTAEELEPRLRACAAISALQFCNCLQMKNTKCVLYCPCMRTLSSIVSGNEDESLVTWQEISPYMIEMGKSITDQLAVTSESPFIGIPALEDVEKFYAFLSPVVKGISDNVDKPIRMQDGALGQISEHLQPLFDLFQQLFFAMDSCLVKAQVDLSIEDGDNVLVLDVVDKAYFLIIKALSDISKIYDKALKSMLKLLDERKILLRTIITNAVITINDFGFLEWLLERTQVLDFICRKHIVRILFPTLPVNPADEILIERSELFVHSYMNISQVEPDNLHSGFSIKFMNENATGHGVMREWILLLCRQIFTPQNSMFIFNPIDQRRFYINPGKGKRLLQAQIVFAL